LQFVEMFRAEGMIKHCRIKQDGRLFVIGNATFETLCDVVSFYENNALFRKMKLRYPATKEMIKIFELVRNAHEYRSQCDDK